MLLAINDDKQRTIKGTVLLTSASGHFKPTWPIPVLSGLVCQAQSAATIFYATGWFGSISKFVPQTKYTHYCNCVSYTYYGSVSSAYCSLASCLFAWLSCIMPCDILLRDCQLFPMTLLFHFWVWCFCVPQSTPCRVGQTVRLFYVVVHDNMIKNWTQEEHAHRNK